MKQIQIEARPASNKIDRFGRVAFNRNRELSQASFQSNRSQQEEQKIEEEEKKEERGAIRELRNDFRPSS